MGFFSEKRLFELVLLKMHLLRVVPSGRTLSDSIAMRQFLGTKNCSFPVPPKLLH